MNYVVSSIVMILLLMLFFPDEDPVVVMGDQLFRLKVSDYLETLKDTRYPKRSDMRVFAKKYHGQFVYIKIRVELMNVGQGFGENYIFIMSFHFSTQILLEPNFPYKKE